jgi:hypothetical protein
MTSTRVQKTVVPNRSTMRSMENFLDIAKRGDKTTSMMVNYSDIPHTMTELYTTFAESQYLGSTNLSVIMEKEETSLKIPENLYKSLTSLTIMADSENNAYDLTDISVLRMCIYLTELSLIGFPSLTNLAPLAGCSKLRRLNISGCSGIHEIQVKFPHLREFTGSGCSSLRNLDFLIESSQLHVVDVSHCIGLKYLYPLENGSFTRLKNVDCSFCSNLYPSSGTFQDLPELSRLYIKGSSFEEMRTIRLLPRGAMPPEKRYSHFGDRIDAETAIRNFSRPSPSESKAVPPPQPTGPKPKPASPKPTSPTVEFKPVSPKSRPASPKSQPASPKSRPASPKSQPASPKSRPASPKSRSASIRVEEDEQPVVITGSTKVEEKGGSTSSNKASGSTSSNKASGSTSSNKNTASSEDEEEEEVEKNRTTSNKKGGSTSSNKNTASSEDEEEEEVEKNRTTSNKKGGSTSSNKTTAPSEDEEEEEVEKNRTTSNKKGGSTSSNKNTAPSQEEDEGDEEEGDEE